ncbi:MAG: NADH-quinone oxidoreductase subunit B [Candidatus Hydrogenedentota bacterium]|nr:MAG: NADH-quinone oxidoreductase subunit B [Candidatus Hydrogenedentota bacterium]
MFQLAEWAITTSRVNSIWPFTFGLACCAIEMMATAAARFDLDRFGAGVFRATPRQSDLMIVSGTVTYKMAGCIERLWHQMPEPKWAIAMGACATNAGPYNAHGYHVVKGVDLIIPVNIYTPGCPPRPESLIGSLLELQKQIRTGKDRVYRAAWEKDRTKAAARMRAETSAAAEGYAESIRAAGSAPAFTASANESVEQSR